MHGLLDTENRLAATIVVSEKDETGHGFVFRKRRIAPFMRGRVERRVDEESRRVTQP